MKNFMTSALFALLLLAVPLLQGCENYSYGPYQGDIYGEGTLPWNQGGKEQHENRWHSDGNPGNFGGDPRSNAVSVNANHVDGAVLLAQDYGIKVSSAQKILALAGSSNKIQALAQLGLHVEEGMALMKYEMPDSTVIHTVAAKLGERPAAIKRLVRDFLQDIKQK